MPCNDKARQVKVRGWVECCDVPGYVTSGSGPRSHEVQAGFGSANSPAARIRDADLRDAAVRDAVSRDADARDATCPRRRSSRRRFSRRSCVATRMLTTRRVRDADVRDADCRRTTLRKAGSTGHGSSRRSDRDVDHAMPTLPCPWCPPKCHQAEPQPQSLHLNTRSADAHHAPATALPRSASTILGLVKAGRLRRALWRCGLL